MVVNTIKELVENLEGRVDDLSTENERLDRENALLKQDVGRLKKSLNAKISEITLSEKDKEDIAKHVSWDVLLRFKPIFKYIYEEFEDE